MIQYTATVRQDEDEHTTYIQSTDHAPGAFSVVVRIPLGLSWDAIVDEVIASIWVRTDGYSPIDRAHWTSILDVKVV